MSEEKNMNSAGPDHEKIRKEIEEIKAKYNFIEPNRGNLDDPNIKWRTHKPVYTVANLEYFKGKTKNHKEGSLEKIVEDLVKTWEMEGSHKVDYRQWTTIDHDNYTVSANGGRVFFQEESTKVGNYNWLMENADKSLYDQANETFETSHHLFRQCFPDAFAWEVLEVFAGPPEVAFTWRHWGHFTGTYKGRKGDNKIYEMFGIGMATVNADLKIQTLKMFYKPNEFLSALEGKTSHESLQNAKSLVGPGCPVYKKD